MLILADFGQAVGGGGIQVPLEILNHLATGILDINAQGALTVEGRALQGLVDELHTRFNIAAGMAQGGGQVGQVLDGLAVEQLQEAGAEVCQAVSS